RSRKFPEGGTNKTALRSGSAYVSSREGAHRKPGAPSRKECFLRKLANIAGSSKGPAPPRPLNQRAKRGETTVLVQDFDFTESCLAKQIDLKEQGPRGVLVLDVLEHLTPVIVALEVRQILPIPPPHQVLY